MSKILQPIPPAPSPSRRRYLRAAATAVATPPLSAAAGVLGKRPVPPAFDADALAELDRLRKPPAPGQAPSPIEQPFDGWGSGTLPPADGKDRPFHFGFIGDTPYNRLDEQGLRRVMQGLDDTELDFVLHVGDIKSRGESCSDALLLDRLEMLDRSRNPLVYTPGDNEWTDCGWEDSYNPYQSGTPLDRLHWLRSQVYSRPESLGSRRMRVEQQRQFIPNLSVRESNRLDQPRLPENMRWRIGSLQFCTIHVVGSNNGMFKTPMMREAWALRQQANAIWLAETAVLARRHGAKGLVIATHANMRFEKDLNDGWNATRQAIISVAADFDGPVALLHGDTHIFRTDRLLLQSHGLDNFTRVECFGSPFTWQWVTIRWNPEAAGHRSPHPDLGPAFKVYTHHA